jgi:hypothetical protein
MLRFGGKYKEVIFGTLFGVGASLIDAAMHASMADSNFFTELVHPTLVMAAYRILFLAFGVGLGMLLWLKNRRERVFRELSLSFEALRRNITAPSMLVHVNLQTLLMQYGGSVSNDALAVIRIAYENSAAIQRVLTDASGQRATSEDFMVGEK